MASLAKLLEEKFEEAVEVKSKRSLHRWVELLMASIVERNEYMNETGSLRSDIRTIAETMKEGFRRMDERFAAVDKRFEAVDKRFEDMQASMNARFEAVDKRFEDMQTSMNARFEDVNRRFTMMFSFMTVGFTVMAILMSVYQFLTP
jgi:chromosome segregation ATPase